MALTCEFRSIIELAFQFGAGTPNSAARSEALDAARSGYIAGLKKLKGKAVKDINCKGRNYPYKDAEDDEWYFFDEGNITPITSKKGGKVEEEFPEDAPSTKKRGAN